MKCIQKLLVIVIGGIIGEASAMQVAPAPMFDIPAGRLAYHQGHPNAGQPDLVATDCYQEITGHVVSNWRLVAGEAAQ